MEQIFFRFASFNLGQNYFAKGEYTMEQVDKNNSMKRTSNHLISTAS